MMGILVFKQLYNPSDKQMEPTPLDRVSYKRFRGLENAPNIPDRTTVWTLENQIEKASAKALSDNASSQLLNKGVIARDGQIIDAPLAPADWKLAKPPQKYLDLSWLQKQGKSHFGTKLSVNTNKKYRFMRKIQTDTVPTHDRQHVEKANMSRKVNADQGEAWLEENSFQTSILHNGHRTVGVSVRLAPSVWHRRTSR